jgi:hypothetical protein
MLMSNNLGKNMIFSIVAKHVTAAKSELCEKLQSWLMVRFNYPDRFIQNTNMFLLQHEFLSFMNLTLGFRKVCLHMQTSFCLQLFVV